MPGACHEHRSPDWQSVRRSVWVGPPSLGIEMGKSPKLRQFHSPLNKSLRHHNAHKPLHQPKPFITTPSGVDQTQDHPLYSCVYPHISAACLLLPHSIAYYCGYLKNRDCVEVYHFNECIFSGRGNGKSAPRPFVVLFDQKLRQG